MNQAALDNMVLQLENEMAQARKKMQEPIPAEFFEKNKEASDPIQVLRENVWKDYRNRRQNKICSRCGIYHKHWITSDKTRIRVDLCSDDKFYLKTYSITSKRIVNKNSLDDDFYDVCKRCQDHITGKQQYLLSEPLEELEAELVRLRQSERLRRHEQESEIRNARKEAVKYRKETATKPSIHLLRGSDTLMSSGSRGAN